MNNTQPGRLIVFLLFTLLLLVGAVVGTYYGLTSRSPGHNDFLSQWEASRSYWEDGLNPYGVEANSNIQTRIYGRPALENEAPMYFVYPFYTVFVMLPIVWLNYAWASAIWMVLLEVCLLGSIMLLLNHYRWKPAPITLGVLLLSGLFFYFPARGLILGQLALFVYFLQVVALWALGKRYDKLAGFALALSTLKPQMGYLMIPFLMLWALREQRWNFIGSFVVTGTVLAFASFAVLPTWVMDWKAQVDHYPSYIEVVNPVWVIANYPWYGLNPQTGNWAVSGGAGHIIYPILSGVVYLYMFWIWYGVLVQRRRERFMWTLVMTLVVTHLVAPVTATPHYVIFMVPFIFYLRWIWRSYYGRGASLYIIGLLIFLFLEQWLHFLLTINGDFEHPSVFLPVPIILFILMIWTRKIWWNDPDDPFQKQDAGV